MKHLELITRIADKSEFNKAQTRRILELLLAEFRDELIAGGEIKLADFGTFSIHQRAAFTGRNPRTGESLEVPAKRVISFTAKKAMREALNPPAPVARRHRA
jgi:DNA-binding protein HU-beta